MFDRLIAVWEVITGGLDRVGAWLPALFLRLILAWEFWEAGITKYNGNNWFSGIQNSFPFPFNVIDPNISWFLATWAELIGAVLLVFGLFTRFASLSLIILTIVAALAVHWPDSYSSFSELWKGYAITNKGFGNFKLPLLYLLMLLPLLFNGAGKASIDHMLKKVID
ncbi:MAG: DoxX family protein [Gammaproteobacteria bacterium]|nr:DoxX family protein [Gammaproteobacteria bacterium]